MYKYLFFLATLILLSACSERTSAVLTSTSPDNAYSISLSGKSVVIGDPWKCMLIVNKKNIITDTLLFELRAENIDTNTVKFDWKSNDECHVKLTQINDNIKIFTVILNDNILNIRDISEIQ
jgi:hypothetical protein